MDMALENLSKEQLIAIIQAQDAENSYLKNQVDLLFSTRKRDKKCMLLKNSLLSFLN